jgi:archaemetzincin
MPGFYNKTACCALLAIMLLMACSSNHVSSSRVVVLIPLGNFPQKNANQLASELKKFHSKVILSKAQPFPKTAYNESRKRYRADKLIAYLKNFGNADTVILGLSTFDISTTKNQHADWGVMGLGYQPGAACVISTWRLNKTNLQNQLLKVAVHELGHTQGLPHCNVNSCYMRDAGGKNPLDEETGFCDKCKTYLNKQGWL